MTHPAWLKTLSLSLTLSIYFDNADLQQNPHLQTILSRAFVVSRTSSRGTWEGDLQSLLMARAVLHWLRLSMGSINSG